MERDKKAKMIVIETIDVQWECPTCGQENINCIPVKEYEREICLMPCCDCGRYVELSK